MKNKNSSHQCEHQLMVKSFFLNLSLFLQTDVTTLVITNCQITVASPFLTFSITKNATELLASRQNRGRYSLVSQLVFPE